MKTLQQEINTAKDLATLIGLLNGFECDDQDEQDEVGNHIDLSGLPTFGDIEPPHTCEVYSWDDDSVLIQSAFDGGFEIVARTSFFGE